jgi:cell division protein FtsL
MRRAVVETGLATAIAVAAVATGIALVTTTQESRRLFRELEALRLEEDRLQGDWSALQLEIGWLAGHSNIDDFARNELGMVEPGEKLEYLVPAR